jgi:uncharacterized protein
LIFKYKDVSLFLLLVYVMTLLFDLLGDPLFQIIPLLVVLIILVFFKKDRKKNVRNLSLNKLGGIRWYFLALLLASIPLMLSFIGAYLMRYVDFHPSFSKGTNFYQFIINFFIIIFKSYSIMIVFPIYILLPLIWAFGEEVGWRGYLQPRLTDLMEVRKALLYTGLIWALYHYPGALMGDYFSSGNIWINLILFTVTLVPLSILMGWIRIKSQSIWPVVLLHAIINQQRHFWSDIFYVKKAGWIYIAGEFGIITLIIWTVLAIFIWNRLVGSKKEQTIK